MRTIVARAVEQHLDAPQDLLLPEYGPAREYRPPATGKGCRDVRQRLRIRTRLTRDRDDTIVGCDLAIQLQTPGHPVNGRMEERKRLNQALRQGRPVVITAEVSKFVKRGVVELLGCDFQKQSNST